MFKKYVMGNHAWSALHSQIFHHWTWKGSLILLPPFKWWNFCLLQHFSIIFLCSFSVSCPSQSPINSPPPFFKPLNPYWVFVLNISIELALSHNPSSSGLPGLSIAPSLMYYVFYLPGSFMQRIKFSLFTPESNMASQCDYVFKIM